MFGARTKLKAAEQQSSRRYLHVTKLNSNVGAIMSWVAALTNERQRRGRIPHHAGSEGLSESTSAPSPCGVGLALGSTLRTLGLVPFTFLVIFQGAFLPMLELTRDRYKSPLVPPIDML